MKSTHVSGPTTRLAKKAANSSGADAAAEYAWKNSVWWLYSGKQELGYAPNSASETPLTMNCG